MLEIKIVTTFTENIFSYIPQFLSHTFFAIVFNKIFYNYINIQTISTALKSDLKYDFRNSLGYDDNSTIIRRSGVVVEPKRKYLQIVFSKDKMFFFLFLTVGTSWFFNKPTD